jgi:hypothetical protein
MGINATYIQGYSSSIIGIINNILIPVLISLAFIVFLWGIYNYFIAGANNDTKRGEGKVFALYGIIGFVILFSVWGIVQIFMGTLGLTATNVPAFPTIGSGTGTSSSLPTGTTGTPAFPGGSTTGTPGTGVGSGTVSGTSAGQSNAYSSLMQQYNSLVANCPSGSTKAATASCQQQISAYNSALNNYKATYPSAAVPSSGTSAENADVGNPCPNGNNDCSSGYCNSNEDTCTMGVVGDGCGNGHDCETGYCDSNNDTCTSGDVSDPCGTSKDCSSGYCDPNTDTCASAPTNGTSAGSSTSGLSNGQDCNGDSSNCTSNYCDPDTGLCADQPVDNSSDQ